MIDCGVVYIALKNLTLCSLLRLNMQSSPIRRFTMAKMIWMLENQSLILSSLSGCIANFALEKYVRKPFRLAD